MGESSGAGQKNSRRNSETRCRSTRSTSPARAPPPAPRSGGRPRRVGAFSQPGASQARLAGSCRGDERAKRFRKPPRANGIGKNILRCRHLSGQRDPRERFGDELRGHGGEDLPQRSLRVERAGRGVDQHGGLAGEGLARHQPVERVLQRAGDPVGVFRGGDDERVARADKRPQRLDRLGLMAVLDVVVRVERRQRPRSR